MDWLPEEPEAEKERAQATNTKWTQQKANRRLCDIERGVWQDLCEQDENENQNENEDEDGSDDDASCGQSDILMTKWLWWH